MRLFVLHNIFITSSICMEPDMDTDIRGRQNLIFMFPSFSDGVGLKVIWDEDKRDHEAIQAPYIYIYLLIFRLI